VADALWQLDDYLSVARKIRKPVVIDEFGLKTDPLTLTAKDYSRPRDELYRAFGPEAYATIPLLDCLTGFRTAPRRLYHPRKLSLSV
jgi:hypothetical protein